MQKTRTDHRTDISTDSLGYPATPDRGASPAARFSPVIPWYVAYTRCHHEQRVARHLALKNVPVLFPKYKTWSRRKDRRKMIELPLFPGYLFIQSEPFAHRFTEISDTPGLAFILGNGNGPKAIADDEIKSLLILLSSSTPFEPHPYFCTGEQVIVLSGPLKGAVGYVLQSRPDKRKLVITVDLLGRSAAVHISDEIVDKY
ncbi:MAG: transcription termination/antitermination NusG family protein [Candidatus Eisenbacteria bacterium]